jgi:hypothetical protein
VLVAVVVLVWLLVADVLDAVRVLDSVVRVMVVGLDSVVRLAVLLTVVVAVSLTLVSVLLESV